MSSAIPTTSTIATSTTTSATFANRASYLAATSVGKPPPPGVTPNFDAPNPNGVFMIVANVVGVTLCFTITAMRLWTKGVLMRTVGWDDCLTSAFPGPSEPIWPEK
ncbi:hypothetical protein MMC29_000796 [Sticta canariensis]|nr:hypothetical protein [Sticta canariensis]